MDWPVIHKMPPRDGPPPNMLDYDAERAAFTWDLARSWLAGLPGGGPNIAHEAVDRHTSGERADHQALRIVHADETVTAYSYRALADDSARFATGLPRTE